jgi:hypothetical protein
MTANALAPCHKARRSWKEHASIIRMVTSMPKYALRILLRALRHWTHGSEGARAATTQSLAQARGLASTLNRRSSLPSLVRSLQLMP